VALLRLFRNLAFFLFGCHWLAKFADDAALPSTVVLRSIPIKLQHGGTILALS
jgi:hypothetical protein